LVISKHPVTKSFSSTFFKLTFVYLINSPVRDINIVPVNFATPIPNDLAYIFLFVLLLKLKTRGKIN